MEARLNNCEVFLAFLFGRHKRKRGIGGNFISHDGIREYYLSLNTDINIKKNKNKKQKAKPETIPMDRIYNLIYRWKSVVFYHGPFSIIQVVSSHGYRLVFPEEMKD